AAEHGVVCTELIVDATDVLSLVAVVRRAVGNLAAWIVRLRQKARHLQRSGTEPRRIDPIIDKPSAEIDRAALTCSGGEPREVAGQHRRSRNKGNEVRRRLTGSGALVAAKEEHPVADDRSADGAAVLIPLQPVVELLSVRTNRGKRALRIEMPVAKKLEE